MSALGDDRSRAVGAGEASVLGPTEYTRLIYAALIGYVAFSEIPDAWTWAGAAIIVASTLYVARHEAMTGRPPVLG